MIWATFQHLHAPARSLDFSVGSLDFFVGSLDFSRAYTVIKGNEPTHPTLPTPTLLCMSQRWGVGSEGSVGLFCLITLYGNETKTKKRLFILYCAHFFVFLQPTNVRLLRNEQRNAPKRLKK